MHDPEAPRMESLPRKLNESNSLRPIHVPLLTHQCVPAQPRLQPDLVPTPRDEADLDERRISPECFDHLVIAAGLAGPRIMRMGLPLNQRVLIPDEMIPPR